MLRQRLQLLLCILFSFRLGATHNRAGEITYTRIAPTTSVVGGVLVEVYRYRITIITYTAYDFLHQIADRCVDTVYFGDGDRGVAPRVNGPVSGCCPPMGTLAITCGSLIVNESAYRVNKNIYVIEHTYPGPGDYLIRSFDPNRNQGVKNIPNSVNQPFYIESKLVINSFSGANSSPILNYAPIDRACLGQCFEHNPGAYDPDGDSLSYDLDYSRGVGGQVVSGYYVPDGVSINARTGLLRWCVPDDRGEYNIAFIVREWRKNTNNVYQQIGYVLRDMQIIVNTCDNEYPPLLLVPPDTCVEAGALIEKNIIVTDPNDGNYVSLIGLDGAFSAGSPVASLYNASGITHTATGGALVAGFKWQTTCDHVREQPYFTTVKAQDNGSIVAQVTFKTFAIRVVPPTVKNVSVAPVGSTMKVSWSLSTCNPSKNPLLSYRIYRKNSCSLYTPSPCSSDIPASSGFSLIGQTDAKTNFFVDNNGGDGLVVGQSYSYLVVAFYTDGTQTFAGTQVCASLKRDVPVLLNVDVLSTAADTGRIKVRWARPLIGTENFDTSTYKGPYKFVLKRTSAGSTPENVFITTAAKLALLDTEYIHANINTIASSHDYVVEFFSGDKSIGSSQKASSVFLSATPSDRRVDLSWSVKTPWLNYKFTIKRKDPTATTYSVIGTTDETKYVDDNKVVNGYTYCYLVESEGAYSDTRIARPLINKSQETCAKAKDLTPPCSPTLSINADCPTDHVEIAWNDVRKVCERSDDVLWYNVFFKPVITDEYKIIATLSHTSETSLIPSGSNLIPGCYAIQAVDSAGNMSPLSPDFCIDNCPIFELPNIFTPNGDNVNDFFKAIRVRQIQQIDLSVFDRWGNLVYKTKDPYFKWDGVSLLSKQEVSEGTFFYICDVFEPRLKGTIKRTLKGYVQMVR